MKVISKKAAKENSVGVWVIVFSVIVSAFFAGFYMLPNFGAFSQGKLSGVVLETGEIYFGELSYFPRLAMTGAYTVQVFENPDDANLIEYRVVPLESSLWSPKKIFLNYDKIVFIGEVGKDSELLNIVNQRTN